MARLARFHGRDADLGLGAARRLLERDLEVVAQVRAAKDGGSPAPAAEDVAEDVAERFGEAKPGGVTHAAHLRIDARVAVCVVGAALLGLREHLVGFLRLLELLLGGSLLSRIAWSRW
jgi:hypothetical protein